MNENTEPSLTNILTSTPPEDNPTPFQCPKCPKSFLTKAGLNMHDMRVHTKKLGTGYNWKGKAKKSYPSGSLALRRRKYHEMRERYQAAGLSAKGRPFKSEWGKRVSLVMSKRPRTQTSPRSLANLRAGTKWTPERKAKFSRTMRRKAREKRMALAGAQMFEAGGKPPKAKRIQYVYPTPQDPDKGFERHPEISTNIYRIRHCPYCGEDIRRHLNLES